MILPILALFTAFILGVLSFLHLFWAAGGKWGIEYTIPDKFKRTFFEPKNKAFVTTASIFVALALLVAALIVSSNYFCPDQYIPYSWTILATRIIGGVFILRAIGDFRIMGIFKKKSDSKFARSDSKFFIPLCLLSGISSILITFLG